MTNYDVTIANYDVTSHPPEVVCELLGRPLSISLYRFASKEDPEDFRLSLRDGSRVTSSGRPTNWRLSSAVGRVYVFPPGVLDDLK